MIENDAQLQQAQEAVAGLRAGLSALKNDPRTAKAYDLLAEGPLDEIKKIEGEISEYVMLEKMKAAVQESDGTIAGVDVALRAAGFRLTRPGPCPANPEALLHAWKDGQCVRCGMTVSESHKRP